MKRIAYVFLFALILIALAQLAWQLPQLPRRVATHFDAQGQADGYMDRRNYGWLMLLLTLAVPGFFVGVAKVSRFLPASMVNIPNKDYWLANHRRKKTMAEVELMLLGISLATQLFFIGLSQLTFSANLAGRGLNMLGFGGMMALYVLLVAASVLWSFWRFRLPEPLDT